MHVQTWELQGTTKGLIWHKRRRNNSHLLNIGTFFVLMVLLAVVIVAIITQGGEKGVLNQF